MGQHLRHGHGMEKVCGIYLIVCTTTSGRRWHYVGQSKNCLSRFQQHRYALKAGRHSNPIMQRLWNKYGYTAFRFGVLETCQPEELNDRENWWLGESVGNPGWMNIGATATAPMLGLKFTDEHRRKIAEAIKGEKHYLYGKQLSDEHRRNISIGGRGKKRSAITRQKIAAANKGAQNSMFGKVGAQNGRSKAVIGIPDGGGDPIKFDSANLAESAGFSQSGITHCIRGRQKSHRGYVWQYAELATKAL